MKTIEGNGFKLRCWTGYGMARAILHCHGEFEQRWKLAVRDESKLRYKHKAIVPKGITLYYAHNHGHLGLANTQFIDELLLKDDMNDGQYHQYPHGTALADYRLTNFGDRYRVTTDDKPYRDLITVSPEGFGGKKYTTLSSFFDFLSRNDVHCTKIYMYHCRGQIGKPVEMENAEKKMQETGRARTHFEDPNLQERQREMDKLNALNAHNSNV